MSRMTESTVQTPSKPIPVRSQAPQGTKTETTRPPQPRVETINASQANHGGILSPVNQNGSFEFDRVLKAGTVVKRTRKTKSWKPIYLVLRPNLLSIYKDKGETKLRHQINLSDVTAVARQKDPRRKMDHVFGLFSPSRNFHFAAPTEKDAQEWVELIRTEARIDEEEEEMILMSPAPTKTTFATFTGLDRICRRENLGSSSSEAEPRPSSSMSPDMMHSARRPSHALSGNEYGSYSDFSDTGGVAPPVALYDSATSLPRTHQHQNVSQPSNVGSTPVDERVVYHGWLYVLKSKGGVRQWKKVWVVLRPKTLGLYKNEEEYSANLVIPFGNIINAVDIDPVSKNKKHCMQIISEERNYRFCAVDENSLARWLGAFKSLLAKRKEAQLHSTGAPSTIPPPQAQQPLPPVK